MIRQYLRTLFWDTNLDNFNPTEFPEYTVTRILELGDRDAIAWLLTLVPICVQVLPSGEASLQDEDIVLNCTGRVSFAGQWK